MTTDFLSQMVAFGLTTLSGRVVAVTDAANISMAAGATVPQLTFPTSPVADLTFPIRDLSPVADLTFPTIDLSPVADLIFSTNDLGSAADSICQEMKNVSNDSETIT